MGEKWKGKNDQSLITDTIKDHLAMLWTIFFLTDLFNRPKGSDLYIHMCVSTILLHHLWRVLSWQPWLWLLLIILKVENREKVRMVKLFFYKFAWQKKKKKNWIGIRWRLISAFNPCANQQISVLSVLDHYRSTSAYQIIIPCYDLKAHVFLFFLFSFWDIYSYLL